jgi:hypothetical protein
MVMIDPQAGHVVETGWYAGAAGWGGGVVAGIVYMAPQVGH